MLERGDVLAEDAKELERLPEAGIVELTLARANVDSLKQDTSLITS